MTASLALTTEPSLPTTLLKEHMPMTLWCMLYEGKELFLPNMGMLDLTKPIYLLGAEGREVSIGEVLDKGHLLFF